MDTIVVKKIKDFQPKIPKKSAFTIETPDDLPKMNQLIVVSAKKGGGKGVFITTFLKKLLDTGVIDTIRLISPTYWSNKEIFEPLGLNPERDLVEPSKEAIKTLMERGQEDQDAFKLFLEKKKKYKLFQKLMKSDTPIHQIDPEMMMDFMEYHFFEEAPVWKFKYERPPREFWLFDDILGTDQFNNKSGLTNACIKHRHIYDGVGVSICILTQSYCSAQGLPRVIRENVSLLALGKCKDENQIEKIHQEIGSDIDLDKFDKLFKYATAEPHSFLVVDFSPKSPEKMFRRNWNEYIYLKNG